MLDASAVVDLLVGGERATEVEREMRGAGHGAYYAPDLLDVEVVQALRRLASAGFLPEGRASATVELLSAFPVERRAVRPLVPRMWALRANLTAYDAAYVALAEVLGRPLLTCDRRLAEAPGHHAEVVLVS